MEKIINLLINNWTKGVDTYTHNGSTWLIFSESKQWVIELTESKTLWYNYNFFKELFSLTSMDVVDNQHYITKWVEDNLINKVKDTILERNITEGEVDDIIQDGVKKTSSNVMMFQSMKVEDTIQNGVKETITSEKRSRLTAENIIENGVRHTEIGWHQCNNIDDAIEKGVKEIYEYKGFRGDVKDVIQDGVKETNHVDVMGFFDNKMEDTLQNGVKETMFNRGHKQLTVKNIIENGVRHTLNTEYMPTSMVEDIIQSGVKHTEYGDWLDGDERLDDIVENGVKETSLKRGTRPFMVNDTLKNGVKETKTPGKDGDIMSTIEWMDENNSSSYTKMINNVIENGIKGTFDTEFMPKAIVEDIIQNGTKNPSV
jgi:hypothetical protein